VTQMLRASGLLPRNSLKRQMVRSIDFAICSMRAFSSQIIGSKKTCLVAEWACRKPTSQLLWRRIAAGAYATPHWLVY